jgi:hypothetical protein
MAQMTWEELTGDRAIILDRVALFLQYAANQQSEQIAADALRNAADDILSGAFEVALAKYDD